MSSFIERFSIAGSGGVLALVVVVGVYGFASIFSAGPDESLRGPPGSEKFLVLEGRGIPIGNQVFRPQATPAETPDEPTPVEPAPLETLGAADEALLELEPAAVAEALSAGSVDGPAAPATPAPAPAPTAVATPAPAPDTAPPPTPEPPAPVPTAPPNTPAPEPTLPPLPTPDPTLPVP